MQRLMRDERGAVAVIVAILAIALLGLTALAVDVSAMWSEKKQLQNGADAGALAIAQSCAKGACGTPSATAQTYAAANRNSGTATGTVLSLTANSVKVQASDPHEHWFARLIDKVGPSNSSDVGARASAKWGAPVSGGTFPLTFSYCEWQWQQTHGGLDGGLDQIIKLSKHSGSDCTGPSGLPLPGGFGWVKPNNGACSEASIIGGMYSSDTGNTPPSGCSPSDFDALIGTTILIPIFDKTNDLGGNNGEYHIYGYAAFTFTGYYFAGTYKGTKICSGTQRCISGHFTKYVTLDEALELGPGPSLGASIVILTP